MIDGLYNTPQTAQNAHQPRKVLHMVKNDRMGGFVPKWDIAKAEDKTSASNPSNTPNTIEFALATAQQNQPDATPENILAFNGDTQVNSAQTDTAEQSGEPFGFGDLLDMVNPLHHIPVVGHAYRELSGDTIRPIGNIIGGGIFGGPLGVVSGLVNTVIQEETGKDVTGNAMAMMLHGEAPSYKKQQQLSSQDPETRLAAAQAAAPEYQEQLEKTKDSVTPNTDVLPGNLLSFVNLQEQSPQTREIKIQRIEAGSGRTAGEMTQRQEIIKDTPYSYREPITQVRLNDLY